MLTSSPSPIGPHLHPGLPEVECTPLPPARQPQHAYLLVLEPAPGERAIAFRPRQTEQTFFSHLAAIEIIHCFSITWPQLCLATALAPNTLRTRGYLPRLKVNMEPEPIIIIINPPGY